MQNLNKGCQCPTKLAASISAGILQSTLANAIYSYPIKTKNIPHDKRTKGYQIETIVIEHLQKEGFQLFQRNFACRSGEIDLIGLHQDQLLFIEVRFRKNAYFGCAASTVNFHKQQKLIKTANFFLKIHPNLYQHSCQFDVVAATLKGHQLIIEWIQNAFH